MRGAAGAFSPVVSTMLPSVCTTISVAFSVFRLSPICRAVLPDCRREQAMSCLSDSHGACHLTVRRGPTARFLLTITNKGVPAMPRGSLAKMSLKYTAKDKKGQC